MKTGDALPEFQLQNESGDTISNKTLQGRYAVVYFYPKDNTPGCTLEGKDFTRLHEEFKTLNCDIYGVSKDSVQSHEKFCKKQNYSISLLSDPGGEFIEKCGVWKEKSMYGKTFLGIVRTTFLVDPDGIILNAWVKVRVKGHAEAVLESLKEVKDS